MCDLFPGAKSFKRKNILDIPDELMGVYGIWFRKYCVYIGRTAHQGLRTRLHQHWNNAENSKLRAWIKSKKSNLVFNYKECDSEIETVRMEAFFYNCYKPITNIIALEEE